jgi:hypothetical protein
VKRFAVLALPLLLLLSSAPARAGAKPLPGGFRDLKWRAPVAKGMKLKKDESAGENADYARPADLKTLHGAVLESITYGYFKGRFCSVTIQTDAGQGAKLLKALADEWGPPEKAATNVYVWKDESETLAFFRGTDLAGTSSRGELYIVCKPLVEEANKAERERREKAAGR